MSAEGCRGLIWFRSPKPILDTQSAFGIFPSHGTIDAGDHAGAAFQAPGKFDGHLFFFGEGIKVCRAGVDAEPFLAGMTDPLVEKDMGFFIVFEGI